MQDLPGWAEVLFKDLIDTNLSKIIISADKEKNKITRIGADSETINHKTEIKIQKFLSDLDIISLLNIKAEKLSYMCSNLSECIKTL